MPWSTSTRRSTLPKDWPIIRARVLARDHGTCTTCGTRATDVDHVTPHHRGGTDHDDNLTSLCRPHHLAKSSREGAEAMASQRAKATHPGERSPGLL